MIRELWISLSLQKTYTVNGIQYWLRKVPLVRRLFRGRSYDAPDWKLLLTILAVLWETIKAVAAKFIYLFLLSAALGWVLTIFEYPSEYREQLLVQTLFFFTLTGGVMNNPLFRSMETDYYAICLLRMDARRYALTHYAMFLLKTLAGFFLALATVGRAIGLGWGYVFLLPLYIAGAKLALIPLELWHARRSMRTHKKRTIFSIAQIAIGVAGALVVPLLFWFAGLFPLTVLTVAMLVFVFLGLLGAVVVIRYPYYPNTYRLMIYEARQLQATAATEEKLEVQASRKLLNKKSLRATSRRQGVAYMHDLFVKRHWRLLWNPALILTGLSVGLTIAVCFFLYRVPELRKELQGTLGRLLPLSVFIMYALNRGLSFTQSLYINCDHSLLTFSFYKERGTILKLFVRRLRSIVLVNLLPAVVIALGLVIVYAVAGGITDPLAYVAVFLTIPSLSVFFSVHYLMLYYLLQPYNAATEIKSPAYSAVKAITYIVSFVFLQMPALKQPILFGLCATAFCILYSLIACLLVYRLAPRTFRIHR